MTHELIDRIKARRQRDSARLNGKLKADINNIRKEIVALSFKKNKDLNKFNQLMTKLTTVKIKLNHVS